MRLRIRTFGRLNLLLLKLFYEIREIVFFSFFFFTSVQLLPFQSLLQKCNIVILVDWKKLLCRIVKSIPMDQVYHADKGLKNLVGFVLWFSIKILIS